MWGPELWKQILAGIALFVGIIVIILILTYDYWSKQWWGKMFIPRHWCRHHNQHAGGEPGSRKMHITCANPNCWRGTWIEHW